MGKAESRKAGQVYAELLCDFMFKRLFGSEANKDVLIGFLNMVMEDHEIVEVDFIPTEHLGLTEDDRKVIFDISCRCRDGETLIIEMQKGYQKHFRKRALYYTTYPINEQARDARDRFVKAKSVGDPDAKFDWDYDLRPVTVVSVLNFRFMHSVDWPADRIRSSYRLREDVSHEVMTDVLRFVFIELGRFRKRIWELEGVFDKWMYLLKHIHEMVYIPKEFNDSLFRRLFMLAKIDKFTAEEYEQYKKSLENMGDYQNIINTAVEEAEIRGRAEGREEGLVEGRAEGLAEGREAGLAEGRTEGLVEGREAGRAEGIVSVARQMKRLGVAVELIAEATGLTVDVINGMSLRD